MLLPVPLTIFLKVARARSLSTNFQQNRLYSVFKMSKQAKWETEKAKILSLSLEEKRKLYKSDDYLIADKIDPWSVYFVRNEGVKDKKHTEEDLSEFRKIKIDADKNKELIDKVSIFKGDITKLEVS